VADPAGPWLAIDSATEMAGLALCDGSRLLAESHWLSHRRHTVELGPRLVAMLEGCTLAPSDLAGIAVAIGPGSYTGLRIGLSLAKGLAMGADLPVVGLPTLDILADALMPAHLPPAPGFWTLLQAGRGRVVAAFYPAAEPALPEGGGPAWLRAEWPDARKLEVMSLEALAEKAGPGAWLAGELDARSRDFLSEAGLRLLPPAACLRRAGHLADLGRRRLAAGAPADPARIEPIYPLPA
jgi:tRNA threonylcarbamoyladenosine biosynthesis protein TsaB